MILVLDANAVVPNPELQGSTWRDVTTAIRDGALTVVVPRIVAAEITARVQKNRRDQRPKSDVHRAPQSVKDALQEALDQVERWAARYDATIHLESKGVVIRDTPTVAHDEVALRAINRGRPFNENGGGYRDALHWYTVLELAREHPDEEIVFVSKDTAYRNNNRDDLHPTLREEAEAVLTTGTIRLCTELKEFVPPQKYAGDEDRVFPEAEHLSELVTALFPDGKLHAPELWVALDLEDPVDADVSDPGTPELVWSYARDLVDGGRSYRTRIRMTARVAFDWIDWPDDDDEGSYQELDVTAWYTVDDESFHVEQDRTNLQPAPVYTPPRLDLSDPLNTRTLTSSAFTLWKNQQVSAALLAAQGPKITLSNEIARQLAANTALGTEIARRAADSAGLGRIGAEMARRATANEALGREIARRAAESAGIGRIGEETARRAAAGITPAWSALPDAARRAAHAQSDRDDDTEQGEDADDEGLIAADDAAFDDDHDEGRQTDD